MKATNIKRKGDRSELLFYCALIALPILQVVIFYFYVNFNSVLMAFKSYDVMSDTFYWGKRIQKSSKKMKKGVDRRQMMWYYN